MVQKPFWIFNVIMHSQYNCNILRIIEIFVSKEQRFKFKFYKSWDNILKG